MTQDSIAPQNVKINFVCPGQPAAREGVSGCDGYDENHPTVIERHDRVLFQTSFEPSHELPYKLARRSPTALQSVVRNQITNCRHRTYRSYRSRCGVAIPAHPALSDRRSRDETYSFKLNRRSTGEKVCILTFTLVYICVF